jgi:diguanylate cyclase (GGDEF)-like protein
VSSAGPLDDLLGPLRPAYLRESLDRLEELARLLDRLAAAPEDAAALRELVRGLHAFSGSGRTYGFPRVSELALVAEHEARDLQAVAGQPGEAHLGRWREAVADLGAELGQAPAPGEWEAPSAPPLDLLVVDASEPLRRRLLQLAGAAGLSGRAAATAAEARACLDERLPDALVVNRELPDGSGFALVEQVRASGGEAVGVVVVSPASPFPDKVEAIQCGADGFFEEPLDWEALWRRVRALLERNRAQPGRVLLVEDEPHEAAHTRRILESAGYEVRLCKAAPCFEASLAESAPDLVLMDILLPGASGLDLVRYLRQDERYATLPVIFLTADVDPRARMASARAGGDDHLVKPVNPGLLLTAVAARIERARNLRGLLERDGLTRLLTHTAFLERAHAALSQRGRHPEVAWVMLDLDHFRHVNDRHGHPVGDRVLATLGGLLRGRLRQTDTVGRFGGEEFAILLDGLAEADAVRLVARLLRQFSAQAHRGASGETFHCTLSAGVAVLGPARPGLDSWQGEAEAALRAAKAGGRNRVRGTSGLEELGA